MAEDHDILSEEDSVWAEDAPAAVDLPLRDPLVNVLLIVALSLVVTLIATTGALYVYLGTLNKAPRTMTERDVAVSETLIAERPNDVSSWAAVAYAYARAGRYDDALDAVSRGAKLDNGEAMAVVKADVLRSAGRLKEAVAAYDFAEEQTKKLRERIRIEQAKVGINRDILDDGALFQVFWGRALAREALGDTKGAIKDYVLASEENPRQSTLWVSLGDLYLKSDETSRAVEAYRSALTYTPDLPEALDGLKRAEEGQ